MSIKASTSEIACVFNMIEAMEKGQPGRAAAWGRLYVSKVQDCQLASFRREEYMKGIFYTLSFRKTFSRN